MTQEVQDVEVAAVVRAAIEQHGASREALVPVLSEINERLGYIPLQAFAEVRELIHEPEAGVFLADSHIFSIASFYGMLSLQPLGEHVIRFCESAPCHVMGGRQVLRALERHLHLRPGETSADGKWSLLMTSCLGVCGVGPVLIIDDDIYGKLTPERVPEILARYA